MKSKILVDVGIIIEYLKTGKGVLPTAYEKYKMYITPITYAELLASSTFQDESLEKEVMDFVKKYFDVTQVNDEIGIETARILRGQDLTLAAAINAATVKINSFEFLTDDKKAFEKIEGVVLVEV